MLRMTVPLGEVIAELRNAWGKHFRDIRSAASPRRDNNVANWSYEPDGSLSVRGYRPGQGNPDAADVAGNPWNNIIVDGLLGNGTTCSCQGKELVGNCYKPRPRCPGVDCDQDRHECACRSSQDNEGIKV